ncbi:hypothetical protein [Flavisolibacter nicotianae]|uniref:hypothetical protein n=1 Tax=Flavisolibacter nicotianae TaxID=2364882 RepID=UPI000EB3AE8D|nr:hypothetical protein [Flavisolibacter nicotianae]
MRYTLLLLFLVLVITGCESDRFDKDKRQIITKDAIRSKLPARARNFDITAFSEDTLPVWTDTLVKRPIRYTLQFIYTDSTGALQNRTGYAIFTPDGKSLIASQIDNSSPQNQSNQ